jgi:hypothetical protein
VAWAIQFDTESPCNHAFVAVGEGRILEARPGGSAFNDWDAYPGTIWLTSIPPPPQGFAAQEQVAFGLRKVPYNFLDIIAIGIAQKRWSPELRQQWDSGHAPWWVKRVARPDRLICSALADLFYQRLGRHLFDDGRLSGLVSPGDLLALNQSLAPPTS